MDQELQPPPAKKTKTVITEEQNAIFRELYERGLRGTGKKYEALLQEAMDRTGLPAKVVHKKVYNMQRTSASNSEAPLRVSSMRRLSAYNVFCQMMGSQSMVKEDRHAIWGVMWSQQTDAQKEFYEEEARRRNNIPIAELTQSEKEGLIKTSLRKIREHFTYLQQFECCHGFFIITEGSGFTTSSCGVGGPILATNEGDLHFRFNEAMEHDVEPNISSKDQRMAERKAAQDKINERYGTFLGLEGPKRFPYGQYKRGEAQFGVMGLPPNILKKRPCDMADTELQAVMDCDFSFAQAYPPPSAQVPVLPTEGTSDLQEPGPSGDDVSTQQTSPVVFQAYPEPSIQVPVVVTEGYTNPQAPGPAAGCVPTQQRSVEPFQDEPEGYASVGCDAYVSQNMASVPSVSAVTLDIPSPTAGTDVFTEHIVLVPHPSLHQSDEESIQTVPHPTNEEALQHVQQLAKAMEKSRSERGTGLTSNKKKSYLEGLLGRAVKQEWKLANLQDGKATGWFTGTIVKKNRTQYAIKFPEEELHVITARSVKQDLLKGTMIFVD